MARRTTGKTRRKTRESTTTRKMSRFLEGVKEIDPNNFDLVQKFVTDHGKIIPARLTGASARQQRQIRKAVRRARVVGMLP